MYLNWNTKVINDFSPENIAGMYDAGFVFTRVDKGVMNQTRSLRIKLSDFELSSENKRIMRKNEHLEMTVSPIPYKNYTWEIGKMAKDFYEAHDADFSANKVKELLTESTKTNFNALLVFKDKENKEVGYVICYESSRIFHYSYPFYVPDQNNPSLGLGMMIKAISYAKEKGLEYIYLGSLQRPSDTYKLQFKGMEWFDGSSPAGEWQKDISPLKEILK